jgi:hypothetical protein
MFVVVVRRCPVSLFLSPEVFSLPLTMLVSGIVVCVVFFLGIYIPVDPFCYKHHFVLPTNAAAAFFWAKTKDSPQIDTN